MLGRVLFGFMTAFANSHSSESKTLVRRATDEDVPALTRLINAAFVVEQVVFDGDRVDDLGVRVYMSSGTFLVAEEAGALAGCVYIEARGDRSYLGLLSVQPELQRSGLGSRLVAAAESFARETGSRSMDLRVISARSEQLLPFYERRGYSLVRTEPFPANIVTKQPSHFLLLSKPLN
jgi:N-acetylglutamate synthase-like GNAT family acetyltransferase